jgi:hypothetical protein
MTITGQALTPAQVVADFTTTVLALTPAQAAVDITATAPVQLAVLYITPSTTQALHITPPTAQVALVHHKLQYYSGRLEINDSVN